MKHLNSNILLDYLHRELGPAEDAKVLAHLETCELCAGELQVEASIAERLRTAARVQELELPQGMHHAIMARIAEIRTSPWERFGAWLRPIIVVPFAAVAAAAAFYLSPLQQQIPARAELPVSYYLQQYAVHAQQNPLADHGTVMLSSFDEGAQ